MQNLRQRIRKHKIRCVPWKIWKGEIELLPVSSKCLFAKNGIEIDIIESELKHEGYLTENETLLEILKIEYRLYMTPIGDNFEDPEYGLMPSDWTEEDFKYYENQNGD